MAQAAPHSNNDEAPFVALEGVDAQAPMRCFRKSPDLGYRESIDALCSIGRAPEFRPDIKQIPDAEDATILIKFVEKEVVFVKDRPVLRDLIQRCGLTDTDLCALMSIKLEEPFPLYRFLNAWLQGQRRDSHVRDKVGPFFKLVYRAMEKLPKVRVPAARAVIVNNIPALKTTYDNYKERLKPGMELSFWSPASFSTKDDVVNREEFVGNAREPAIVYMCGALEGVDLEPFKPRGLNPEHEVMPLCPMVCRVTAAVKLGAKLVVSLSQDLEQHAEQAYVAPTGYHHHQPQLSPGRPVSPAVPNAVAEAPLRHPNVPQAPQTPLNPPTGQSPSQRPPALPFAAAAVTSAVRDAGMLQAATGKRRAIPTTEMLLADNEPFPMEDVPGDVIVDEHSLGNNKREILYKSGKKEVFFSNGTKKVVLRSGHVALYFVNGDIKRTFPSGKSTYWYASAQTTHTELADGVQIFEFHSRRQTEKHSPDGTKEILYPDGIFKVIFPDRGEETHFPDGSCQVQPPP